MRAEVETQPILFTCLWAHWSFAFPSIWTQWTVHEQVSHPLVIKFVSRAKLVTMLCEVNCALEWVGERHGEPDVSTIWMLPQSNGIF
jgi:hypothetical protein